jgi:quinol-cytochrome oxidoreductase complex cytochrome b subunit
MTRKAYQARKKGLRKKDGTDYPFYPNHVLRGLMVVAAAAAVIAFLSAVYPPSMDRAADPFTGPGSETRALWILKPAIMAEKVVHSRTVTSAVAAVLLLGLVLLPFLDRTGQRRVQKRLHLAVPLLILIFYFILSILVHSGGLG